MPRPGFVVSVVLEQPAAAGLACLAPHGQVPWELSRYPRITWLILVAECSKRKAGDAWMHAAKRVKLVSLCAQPSLPLAFIEGRSWP